jgi:hypothetical protein
MLMENSRLHDQHSPSGENALVLLMRVLSARLAPGDACHQRLADLASEFEREVQSRNRARLERAERAVPQDVGAPRDEERGDGQGTGGEDRVLSGDPWRLALRMIAVLSWIVALTWFIVQPDFEPLLAFLGGAALFLGSFAARDGDGVKGVGKGALPRPSFGYRKRYLQHLVYRHRDFDVKGLSTQGTFTLELERVFVDLRVAPLPAHAASADPIHALPKELRTGGHAIWAYLGRKRATGRHLAVIGPPGSGKTTLLKHVTLMLAAERRQRRQAGAPNRLPILLFLRDHAEQIGEEDADPGYDLLHALRDSLTRWGGPGAPAGWFERRLRAGRGGRPGEAQTGRRLGGTAGGGLFGEPVRGHLAALWIPE